MQKNQQVSEYIQNQPPLQKEICQALRDMIATKSPELVEELKWYSPVYTKQNGSGVCHIKANLHDVNFGFDQGAHLKDPRHLLIGTGKNMRHVKFKQLSEIDFEYLAMLLHQTISLK